jgi:cytochrome c biogenesis protein CcmG, thiol:disulfide interchange protein DsbE
MHCATLCVEMRRLALITLLAALLGGCGDDGPKSEAPPAAEVDRALEGSPGPLARLHDQENELLGGGPDAFESRLAELKGYPVVVNKWASWCGPCRAEFPFFQKQALAKGRKIAFMGVNSNDNDGAAERFLREYPVPYPSYRDPDSKIAQVFNAVAAFPATAYYDAKGKLAYVRQGGYGTEQQLAEDVDRYAR